MELAPIKQEFGQCAVPHGFVHAADLDIEFASPASRKTSSLSGQPYQVTQLTALKAHCCFLLISSSASLKRGPNSSHGFCRVAYNVEMVHLENFVQMHVTNIGNKQDEDDDIIIFKVSSIVKHGREHHFAGFCFKVELCFSSSLVTTAYSSTREPR
jgi:hypothetical protein